MCRFRGGHINQTLSFIRRYSRTHKIGMDPTGDLCRITTTTGALNLTARATGTLVMSTYMSRQASLQMIQHIFRTQRPFLPTHLLFVKKTHLTPWHSNTRLQTPHHCSKDRTRLETAPMFYFLLCSSSSLECIHLQWPVSKHQVYLIHHHQTPLSMHVI